MASRRRLRPVLTPVGANCDYERFREELARIEANIRASRVESMAIEFALEGLPARVRPMDRRRRARIARMALRMELLRHLLGRPSFRAMSIALAGSSLLSDFCGIRDKEGIKWSSKSTIQRASKFFSAGQLREMNALLAKAQREGWRVEEGVE